MRHRVFEDGADDEIDKYDVQCKEWGFLCRELFGPGLGTGDYGHLTVEHYKSNVDASFQVNGSLFQSGI